MDLIPKLINFISNLIIWIRRQRFEVSSSSFRKGIFSIRFQSWTLAIETISVAIPRWFQRVFFVELSFNPRRRPRLTSRIYNLPCKGFFGYRYLRLTGPCSASQSNIVLVDISFRPTNTEVNKPADRNDRYGDNRYKNSWLHKKLRSRTHQIIRVGRLHPAITISIIYLIGIISPLSNLLLLGHLVNSNLIPPGHMVDIVLAQLGSVKRFSRSLG